MGDAGLHVGSWIGLLRLCVHVSKVTDACLAPTHTHTLTQDVCICDAACTVQRALVSEMCPGFTTDPLACSHWLATTLTSTNPTVYPALKPPLPSLITNGMAAVAS